MVKSKICNLQSAICNRTPVCPSARLPVLSLAVWLLACTSADVPATWTGTVSDSSGVTIVSNTNQGAWTEADRWSVEQDLVIGVMEGDPNYIFGRISGICVDSQRHIYVLDAEASRVSVYDPEGSFLYGFGEKGRGPGQLTNLVGPCLMGTDDSLYIPDLQNFRLNSFASDGSFGGSYRIDMMQGIPIGWDVMSDGRLAQQLRFFGILGGAGLRFGDSMQVIVARERDGSANDTLLEFPAGGTVDITVRRGGSAAITFFAREPSWDVRSDGKLLYGMNDEYRIKVFDENGNLERITAKPFEPEPVGEADREIVIQAAMDFMRASGIPETALERSSEIVRFAETFPAYHRFLTGPQESLWVQRVVRPSELSEEEQRYLSAALANLEAFLTNPHLAVGSRDWDVFDADGRLLGVVTMPPRFKPWTFVGDEVFGVWQDEVDVNYVMRLRVVGLRVMGL